MRVSCGTLGAEATGARIDRSGAISLARAAGPPACPRSPRTHWSVAISRPQYAVTAGIQTLPWQGAHVVAQIGVAAPRTKSDADGRLTDDATIAEIERLTAVLVDSPTLEAAAQLELVRTVVAAAGVDIGRIAQPASRP